MYLSADRPVEVEGSLSATSVFTRCPASGCGLEEQEEIRPVPPPPTPTLDLDWPDGQIQPDSPEARDLYTFEDCLAALQPEEASPDSCSYLPTRAVRDRMILDNYPGYGFTSSLSEFAGSNKFDPGDLPRYTHADPSELGGPGETVLDALPSSEPDMDVEKYIGAIPNQLYRGHEVTYIVRWQNLGGFVAQNVVVTDTLPISLTFISATGRSFTPSYTEAPAATLNGQDIIWNLGDVEPGWYGYLYVTALVLQDAAAGAQITNLAEISLSPGELITTNNTYSTTDTIYDPAPDLSVSKSIDSAFYPEKWLSYRIYWRNQGVITAENVIITDVLPLSLDYGGYWGYSYRPYYIDGVSSPSVEGNTLVWNIGQAAPGWFGYINIWVRAPASTLPGMTFTNVVDIDSGASDPITENNRSILVNRLLPPAPDMRISKWLGGQPGNHYQGHSSQYTLYWTNVGVQTAQDVVITDTLPMSVTFLSSSGYGYAPDYTVTPTPTISGREVTWHLGNVGEGDYGYIYLEVLVRDDLPVGSSSTNQAEVGVVAGELITENNAAAMTNAVLAPAPDTSVSKWLDWGSFYLGNEVSYAIYWSNSGVITAENVLLTDTLPASLEYLDSWGYSYTPDYTDTVPSAAVNGNEISWDLGDIKPGWSGYFYVRARVKPDVTEGSWAINQVEISPGAGETGLNNNVGFRYDQVKVPRPDMVIDKNRNNNSFYPGSSTTYRIYWANQGVTTAVGVVITDILPLTLTYTGGYNIAYAPNYIINYVAPIISGNTIIWDLGNVEPNWYGNIYLYTTVNANAAPGSQVTNSAAASVVEGETNTANNTSQETDTVLAPAPDMFVNKNLHWDSEPFYPDAQIVYEVYWNNQGILTAEDVTITDTWPISMTYEGGWNYAYVPNYIPDYAPPLQ